MNGYHVKVEGLFDDEIIYIRTGLEFEVFEFYMKEMFRNKSVFCVSNYNKPYIYERQNIMCLSYWFEVPFDVYCDDTRHRDIFLELFSAWWCRGLLELSEEERKRLIQGLEEETLKNPDLEQKCRDVNDNFRLYIAHMNGILNKAIVDVDRKRELFIKTMKGMK